LSLQKLEGDEWGREEEVDEGKRKEEMKDRKVVL
jgi:hypothetical protein